MNKSISFRRKVYLLLDAHDYENNLASHENQYMAWGKRFDYFMQMLILLNVCAFVLETIKPIYQALKVEFELFETVSVGIFTLEYLLRIWSITESSAYPKTWQGRWRYMTSPMAVIDVLAFLPAYLPLIYQDLRIVRAFRLFRLFRLLKLWRYSSSLRMLIKVIVEKRSDLQVIGFTIVVLMVVSASLMFMLESEVQPNAFSSIPKSMWWAVVTLTTVGYGDMYPMTDWGKVLGAFTALLGVGLIALPSGIISAGFVQEIHRNTRLESAYINAARIRKAFQTSANRIGTVSTFHRAIDMITLKSRLQLSEEDIFEAIQRQAGLRVRYKKNTKHERFANTLVLEYFELNRSYGCYINRSAEVAIISPMSHAEHAIGHFTAHLAKYIEADYVSNEMYGENDDLNVDYAFSFSRNHAYTLEHPQGVPKAFLDFKSDLKQVIEPHEMVFIFKSSTSRNEDFNIHFGGKLNEEGFKVEDAQCTVRNVLMLENFYEKLRKNFEKEDFNYSFAMHKHFDNTKPDSLHQYLAKTTHASVVTIYVNTDLIEWSDDETYYRIIRILGDTITNFF
jgi:voltage-gated potassium channel